MISITQPTALTETNLKRRSVCGAVAEAAEEVARVDEGQAVLVHAPRHHQPPQTVDGATSRYRPSVTNLQ